jgi:hypothetical protein
MSGRMTADTDSLRPGDRMMKKAAPRSARGGIVRMTSASRNRCRLRGRTPHKTGLRDTRQPHCRPGHGNGRAKQAAHITEAPPEMPGTAR